MPRDSELIAGMSQGQPRAFADLYRGYRQRLHQYALSLVRSRAEAEDVVHDVFIGLARQVGGGREPRNVAGYLYAAVRNQCLDRLRRRREEPLDPVAPDLVVPPADDAERVALGRVLNRALRALPAEQAEVIVLRTWHDLDYAAIAELQGTSINTALSRYQYGLAKLRRELGVDER